MGPVPGPALRLETWASCFTSRSNRLTDPVPEFDLDSGEVVVVSMAGSTIRVTALRRILVVVPWVETI